MRPSSPVRYISMRALVMKEGSSVASFARAEEDVFRISEEDDRQSRKSRARCSAMLGCAAERRERSKSFFLIIVCFVHNADRFQIVSILIERVPHSLEKKRVKLKDNNVALERRIPQ